MAATESEYVNSEEKEDGSVETTDRHMSAEEFLEKWDRENPRESIELKGHRYLGKKSLDYYTWRNKEEQERIEEEEKEMRREEEEERREQEARERKEIEEKGGDQKLL